MDREVRVVASELHDGAMQELTLARLQLDLLRARVAEDRALTPELDAIAELLESASGELQRALRALGATVR